MKLDRRQMLVAMATTLALGLGAPSAFAAEAERRLDLSRVFPRPGAADVPPDAPLRIAFERTPSLGRNGQLRVFDASDDTLVEAISFAEPIATRTIGGLPDYRYHRVLVMDREVIVTLQPGALRQGREYYVTIDAGALADEGGGLNGIGRAEGWKFSTRLASPWWERNERKLTVAADGSGDFCTLQGALDFVPDGNTAPTTILMKRGQYPEIIFFTNKHGITIRGEDRKGTVIAYPNNARFNPSGGNPFGGRLPNPGGEPVRGGNIYRRGMILAHRSNDLTIENLTLHNTTPQGGSQAEALILNGGTDMRATLRDLDLRSFQDTLQINGQAYVSNCYIEGDVDFMWGTGPVFFENCTARSVRSKAYYTQVRNPATNRGFVYVGCTFEGAPGVADNFLSRIEPARFPHSEVVLIDCRLGPSVSAAAWLLDPYPKGAAIPPIPDLRFWEFNSRDPNGAAIDASGRMPGSRQLRLPEDADLIAKYRDPSHVLGGWNPR